MGYHGTRCQTRGRKGRERGTARNFIHSFPFSGTPVVESYLSRDRLTGLKKKIPVHVPTRVRGADKSKTEKDTNRKRQFVHRIFVHNFCAHYPPSQPAKWGISSWISIGKASHRIAKTQNCEQTLQKLRTNRIVNKRAFLAIQTKTQNFGIFVGRVSGIGGGNCFREQLPEFWAKLWALRKTRWIQLRTLKIANKPSKYCKQTELQPGISELKN